MSFPIDLLSRITDIQSTRPDVQVKLTRVGVKNLKLNLQVLGEKGSLSLFPSVDLFVDLPSDKRGVHLSRDPESLHEVLEEQGALKAHRVEEFCETIARRLLQKHKYAKRAEARLKSDYVVMRQPPSIGKPSQEPCKIFALVTATKNNDDIAVQKMVGASVVGFTACPCTQGLLKALSRERLKEMGYKEQESKRIVDHMPLATHTQRTKGTILMQIPTGFSANLEDFIDIAEGAMSGQTYGVLKRPAEASVMVNAITRARFTEDVVREILWALAKKYKDFPDHTQVFAQAYSEESVHKHDVIAERMATLGEIREEIKSNK